MIKYKSIANLFREVLRFEGVSLRKMAEMLGLSPQALNSRMNFDAFKAGEWIKWADVLGYDVIMVRRRDCLIARERNEDAFPRVRSTVDGVEYDTAKANFLCESQAVGFNLRMYAADDGLFFGVHVDENDPAKSTVMPFDQGQALTFVSIHGDLLASERFFYQGKRFCIRDGCGKK